MARQHKNVEQFMYLLIGPVVAAREKHLGKGDNPDDTMYKYRFTFLDGIPRAFACCVGAFSLNLGRFLVTCNDEEI